MLLTFVIAYLAVTIGIGLLAARRVHGAKDYRVPDAQGLAYYNTLKAKGVDARLLWYPDENHWILKPANNVVWYHEFFNWIRRYDPAFQKKKQG